MPPTSFSLAHQEIVAHILASVCDIITVRPMVRPSGDGISQSRRVHALPSSSLLRRPRSAEEIRTRFVYIYHPRAPSLLLFILRPPDIVVKSQGALKDM
ncbi:hypothetical protein R3P38DRAFT_3201454 [Favolaschia claudopus]|uniref:Uncharacterized protein n=1 Tax=Favolaschia claudopus TaxID=2862362 RepID=A0AAW0AX97_9AGAR